jgi:hypothetical protein
MKSMGYSALDEPPYPGLTPLPGAVARGFIATSETGPIIQNNLLRFPLGPPSHDLFALWLTGV